jgi:hypothetical protein
MKGMDQSERLRLIFEACIYLGLLLFLAQQKPLISTLKALRPLYQVFLAGLVVAMVGAQLSDGGKRTFPFVVWSMYTRPADGDPQFYDYSAVSQDGREMPLDVFRVSRTLSFRLMFPLRDMARKIEWAGEGSQRRAMIADYETILRAVARMYNRRHPDDPIRTIYVWHCTIPLHAYRTPASIQRRLLWQLQVQ